MWTSTSQSPPSIFKTFGCNCVMAYRGQQSDCHFDPVMRGMFVLARSAVGFVLAMSAFALPFVLAGFLGA